MARPALKDDRFIQEAIDQLTKIADINIDELIEHPGQIKERVWVDIKDPVTFTTTIKRTFQVIHKYLKDVYALDEVKIKDNLVRKGVLAMMSLAGEAAEKIDEINSFFHKEITASVKESKEFKDLQEFYHKKLHIRFQKALQEHETWVEEWAGEQEDVLDIKRLGLKDLETVKKDWEYELFYLKKEDGRAFFTPNLLKHIRLVTDFDKLISAESLEDPFISVALITDKSASLRSYYIKQSCLGLINSFYRGYKQHQKEELAQELSKALMALFLAANEQNRLEVTPRKNSMKYLHDFLFFIRSCLQHSDYHLLMEHPPLPENFGHKVLQLIHVCCYFFYHAPRERTRSEQYIMALLVNAKSSKEGLWNQLIDHYDHIENMLKHHPSGPLLKAIDYFKEGDHPSFNPNLLENYPEKAFSLSFQDHKIDCLKLPSPTHQEFIQTASPAVEFMGCLQYMASQEEKNRLLMFNLQDRTSWKEYARSKCLEDLQYDGRYKDVLCVVSIPKHTDFYKQLGDYIEGSETHSFIQSIYDHLESHEACGFYFPKQLSTTEILQFSKKIIPWIHTSFFYKADIITRQNRLDFIEIFFQFLILKIIERLKPNEFSFTCKDWIDVGSVQTATFYAFLQLISGKIDDDTIAEMENICFLPALCMRERLVDQGRFYRMVGALSQMQQAIIKDKKIIEEVFHMFATLLKTLKIRRSN
ncbi:MAG: hypothetical protein HY860_04300 [Chlamydiales bacterium]|nr:hypothetical protein [Chlamydiales bacterium]